MLTRRPPFFRHRRTPSSISDEPSHKADDSSARDPLLGLTAEDLRPSFHQAQYYEINGDVKAAGVDGLDHYLSAGWRENRRVSFVFDADFYRQRHMPDMADVCPLAHFVRFGVADKLATNAEQLAFRQQVAQQDHALLAALTPILAAFGHDAVKLLPASGGCYLQALFSAENYRKLRGFDDNISDLGCFARYLISDFADGLSPGPLFDTELYLRRANFRRLPPLAAKQTAVEHWIEHGILMEIVPNRVFHSADYIQLNLDLTRAIWPFEHFLLLGAQQKRRFNKDVTISETPMVPGKSLGLHFIDQFGANNEAMDELQKIRDFRLSNRFRELFAEANTFEPDVGLTVDLPSLMAPWHDAAYRVCKRALDRLPEGRFESVVLIPFCKIGGADYVAGILAQTLAQAKGPVLVVQTDQDEFARPDWFPDIARVDLSDIVNAAVGDMRTQVLYTVLRKLRPAHIFNVNSRLGFDTFVRYGRQLAYQSALHSYYFCAERTDQGAMVGYPIMYFADLFSKLTSSITDSRSLEDELAERFGLPASMRKKLRTVYSPAMLETLPAPLVVQQVASAGQRHRPALIWAGRLDKQKRFDILLDVARQMPQVDFLCWGKAVLSRQDDALALPKNVTLNAPFSSYDELPLDRVDGFFYTADWDGIPTILIELGARGMPITASAAGGVPELLGEGRGWTVPVGSPVDAYVQALRQMLNQPKDRVTRATALQDYVRRVHSVDSYRKSLDAILTEDLA